MDTVPFPFAHMLSRYPMVCSYRHCMTSREHTNKSRSKGEVTRFLLLYEQRKCRGHFRFCLTSREQTVLISCNDCANSNRAMEFSFFFSCNCNRLGVAELFCALERLEPTNSNELHFALLMKTK